MKAWQGVTTLLVATQLTSGCATLIGSSVGATSDATRAAARCDNPLALAAGARVRVRLRSGGTVVGRYEGDRESAFVVSGKTFPREDVAAIEVLGNPHKGLVTGFGVGLVIDLATWALITANGGLHID